MPLRQDIPQVGYRRVGFPVLAAWSSRGAARYRLSSAVTAAVSASATIWCRPTADIRVANSQEAPESMAPLQARLHCLQLPGCSMFLDKWQYTIAEMEGTTYGANGGGIPVLTYEEMAGLVLGYDPVGAGHADAPGRCRAPARQDGRRSTTLRRSIWAATASTSEAGVGGGELRRIGYGVRYQGVMNHTAVECVRFRKNGRAAAGE